MVEVDRPSDHSFDLFSRPSPHLSYRRTSTPDYDALLTFALHEDRDPNLHGISLLAKLIDSARDPVRNLMVEFLHTSLAYVFLREETHRPRGALLCWEQRRRLGEQRRQDFDQLRDPGALNR